MIIVKVINQRVVQIAFKGPQPNLRANPWPGQLLLAKGATSCQLQPHRCLTQSQAKSQKLGHNQKRLVPISKSIYFRQCAGHPRDHRQFALAKLEDAQSSGAASFYSATSACQASSDQSVSLNGQYHPLESLVIEEQQKQQQQEQNKTTTTTTTTSATLNGKPTTVSGNASINYSQYKNQSFDRAITTSLNGRKLVVIMSWLDAREKHIEKYRQFYLDRGFDVLNVKTSPWDILLPNHCAKRISHDCVKFLIEKQYDNVLYHGFSVGGFMFGQVMLHIQQQSAENRQQLVSSIRGLVMDSLVTFEDAPRGISKSITDNPYGAKALEYLIKLYLILGHNISTKYFKEVSKLVWSGPLNCPSLFFISKDDRIVDYRSLERLADTWAQIGIETHKMIVDDSPHVQIFRDHYEAYSSRVDGFLERIKML